jgi:carboxypeptidase D
VLNPNYVGFDLNPPYTVDQPAGTGFSYTSTNRYVHELSEVRFPPHSANIAELKVQAAYQFNEFLQNFYNVFPEYAKMDASLSIVSWLSALLNGFIRHILVARATLGSTSHTLASRFIF